MASMMNYQNYCKDLRPQRTQFDKDMQNMWCSSCCGVVNPTTAPPLPTTIPATTRPPVVTTMPAVVTTMPATTMPGTTRPASLLKARYGNALEDVDRRGVKVAGVY
ncbi:MAG: hypothetical protein EB127_19090 [Alphaproteobacteria bacterium]|nr:hypothetical protein [Alphaproteobacteria bacterium]